MIPLHNSVALSRTFCPHEYRGRTGDVVDVVTIPKIIKLFVDRRGGPVRFHVFSTGRVNVNTLIQANNLEAFVFTFYGGPS